MIRERSCKQRPKAFCAGVPSVVLEAASRWSRLGLSSTLLLVSGFLFWLPPVLLAERPVSVPQELATGDIQIEMGRPLRLRLSLQDEPPLWNCAVSLARALAPAAPSTLATSPPLSIEAVVLWKDPVAGERTVPVSGSIAEISIPTGPVRTAVYSIVWKAQDGSFELRVPASPGHFKAQVVRPQPAIVVEATGSAEGVLLGDQLPIRVRVTDTERVRSVHLFYRSTSAGASTSATASYTSAPMDCAEQTADGGLWKGTIPRPHDIESTIDYYVNIVDAGGRNSTYGTSTAPHRIRLREPDVVNPQ